MPWNPKHWLTEPPLWPWGVFFMHLALGIVFIVSCFIMAHKFNTLESAVNLYSRRFDIITKANAQLVEVVAERLQPTYPKLKNAIEYQKSILKKEGFLNGNDHD